MLNPEPPDTLASHLWPKARPDQIAPHRHPPRLSQFIFSPSESVRYSCKTGPLPCGFTPLLAPVGGAQGTLPFAAHTFLPACGSRERRLTGGAGAEPVGGLQGLDAGGVLAGDVDGGGLRCRRMQPGFTGGLRV